MLTNSIESIPSMPRDMLDRVRRLEQAARKHPQLKIPMQHYLHGGMYVRTCRIPAGVMITGALIIIETNLVVDGHAIIHTGERWVESTGYKVIPASAHRKQIFIALSDIYLTMFFPTEAKTVRDAEEQFTSEADLLQNRG